MVRKIVVDKQLAEAYNIIGINVGRLRGRLTKENLAKKAGLSRQTISAIEAGQSISLESLVRIANALNVPLADLFITDEKRGEVSYMHILLMEKLAESFGIKPKKSK